MQLRDALVMAHGPNETGVIGIAKRVRRFSGGPWTSTGWDWRGGASGVTPGSISSYFASLGRLILLGACSAVPWMSPWRAVETRPQTPCPPSHWAPIPVLAEWFP